MKNKLIWLVFIFFVFTSCYQASEWYQTLESDFNIGLKENIDTQTDPDQIQLAIKNTGKKVYNLLSRKNGAITQFFPSEYTKSFDSGPGQFLFVNDGITDAGLNKNANYQISAYLSDDLSAYSNPFPQDFIFSLPEKQTISTFVLYNGPGSDAGGADSEINNFKLYSNNDVVTPDDILSIEEDGGGWCYKGVSGEDIVFQPLSPKNVFGDIPFASKQKSKEFSRDTWVQSKDLEFNLNKENPKWIKIYFKKPTEISSIFIMSDDGANVDNLETDIFNLEIIVHSNSYGDESVYDNSDNKIVQNDYSKGFYKIFNPVLANAVTIKFHSPKYVEWQKLIIFKSPWKEIVSAKADIKDKDYSPQVFTFNATEPFQYFRLSVESNHGNKRWLSFGEIEAYSILPKNIASSKNGRAKIMYTTRGEGKEMPMSVLNNGKITYNEGFNFGLERPDTLQYAILDLGGRKTFNQIAHWNCGWYGARSVTIYASMDLENWNKIGLYENLNLSRPQAVNKDTFNFEPVSARYVKFEYNSNSWNSYTLRISEYEIFSCPVEYDPSGLYVSPVLNCKQPVKMESISFNQEPEGDIPLNTSIELTIKSGTNNNLSGTQAINTWKFENNNIPKSISLSDSHTGNQYFQYHVKFNTNIPFITPVFSDFNLIYKTPQELYADANYCYDIEKYEEALKNINIFIENFSGQTWIDKAAVDLKTAILLKIDEKAQNIFDKGMQSAGENNLEMAQRILQSIIAQYPSNSFNDKIKIQLEEIEAQKQYQELVSSFEKDPENTSIKLKGLSNNFPKTKWGQTAKEKAEEFLEIKIKTLYEQGIDLFNDNKFIAAKGIFEKLIEKFPLSSYVQRAENQILVCNDKILEDMFFKASSLYKEGNTKEAGEILFDMIQINPGSEWIKKLQGIIEEKNNENK
ncbi:MAG: discoidin domain-containing protein [bacterium]|nr:discoidin domain-containing protein [bacterium]